MATPLRSDTYRVYGKNRSLQIYRQIKGTVFNEYHHLFSLCVFLGYKSNKKQSIRGGQKELFWSSTFSKYEYAAFDSLFIKESEDSGYYLLKNGEKALEFLQEYAEGGMDVFLESDIMRKYVKRKNGETILDFGKTDHLQKQIMYYVYEQCLDLS